MLDRPDFKTNQMKIKKIYIGNIYVNVWYIFHLFFN